MSTAAIAGPAATATAPAANSALPPMASKSTDQMASAESAGSVALGASSCPCPQCGFAVGIPVHTAIASDADVLLRQARQQIQALESQVVLLDQKAAAAIDRWADYEDELVQLRRQLTAATGAGGAKPSRPTTTVAPPPPPSLAAAPPLTPASPTRTSFLPTGAANRLSALLSPRTAKSTPNLKAAAASTAPTPPPLPTAMPTPPPSATNNSYAYTHSNTSSYSSSSVAASPPPRTPYGSFPFFGGKGQTPPLQQQLQKQQQQQAQDAGPSTKELLDALTREQKLRRAAEGRLQDTSREVEELSVSLFEQANEMVAEERRARARLEARVAVLEQRDTDKKQRLERLEQAMVRIERVRAMLGQSVAAVASTPPTSASASTPAIKEHPSSSHRRPPMPVTA